MGGGGGVDYFHIANILYAVKMSSMIRELNSKLKTDFAMYRSTPWIYFTLFSKELRSFYLLPTTGRSLVAIHYPNM